jgi:uncharacterized BrkB/YihY/UPF0761 family membrane protein
LQWKENGLTQYLLAPFRFLIDWLVRFIEDDGLASAGYLAYLGLMSLLPFLVFVFTLLGLIGRADEGAGIVDMMFWFMPTEVALTLQEPVVQVVGTASGGALFIATAALYHSLPNRQPSWIEVIPGAAAVFVMVAEATSLYSVYLEHFAQYAAIYGSLGGIISTLIFLYLLGAIFVLGAELNGMLSEIYDERKEGKQE